MRSSGGGVPRLVIHGQVLHRELGVDEGLADQPGQRAPTRLRLRHLAPVELEGRGADELEEPGVGGERFDV